MFNRWLAPAVDAGYLSIPDFTTWPEIFHASPSYLPTELGRNLDLTWYPPTLEYVSVVKAGINIENPKPCFAAGGTRMQVGVAAGIR